MALDYVLEGLHLFEVLGEEQPVLLNHFVAEIVNEVLDKVYHPLVEQVSRRVERERDLLGLLQGQPDRVELPFQELAPEDQTKQQLVFAHALLVEDQRQGKLALVLYVQVVNVLGFPLHERLFAKVEV